MVGLGVAFGLRPSSILSVSFQPLPERMSQVCDVVGIEKDALQFIAADLGEATNTAGKDSHSLADRFSHYQAESFFPGKVNKRLGLCHFLSERIAVQTLYVTCEAQGLGDLEARGEALVVTSGPA